MSDPRQEIDMQIGQTVTVRHETGVERGRVAGVQNDPATGRVGWVQVEFADRTNSSWPIARVEG